MNTRPPAVAGLFYPAAPDRLRAAVDALLAGMTPSAGPPPKALIAPHAGYVYSGAVAAAAFAALRDARGVERVVVIGPAHYVAVAGVAVPTAHAFQTPLGPVSVDRQALAAIADLPFVAPADGAHAPEHALEVELPFLQAVLGDFAIVPLLVGDAGAQQVAEILRRLWGGPETLIVVSSDLSHYHDYDTARRLDAATAARSSAATGRASARTTPAGSSPLRAASSRRGATACRRAGWRSATRVTPPATARRWSVTARGDSRRRRSRIRRMG